MTRLQALVLLLEGWLDYHPWPAGSSAFRGESGPAPSRVVVCRDCDGQGLRQGGWRCERCGGRGRLSVDAYTGEPVADEGSSLVELLDTWVACSSCAGGDRQCGRCNGTGREAALLSGKVRVELEGRARSRQGDGLLDGLADGAERRQGSATGVALEAGMRELRLVDPVGHGVIVWCLVLGQVPLRALDDRERVALVAGLARLSGLLPGRLVVPGELVRAARARGVWEAGRVGAGRRLSGSARSRRDAAIRELWACGSWSQAALAVRFGVHQSTVCRVLQGERVGVVV